MHTRARLMMINAAVLGEEPVTHGSEFWDFRISESPAAACAASDIGSRGTFGVSRNCQSRLALARIHDRPVLRSTVDRCAGYSDDRRWGDMVKGVLRQHGCAFLDVMSAACGVCRMSHPLPDCSRGFPSHSDGGRILLCCRVDSLRLIYVRACCSVVSPLA
jgi:hypothetical protein